MLEVLNGALVIRGSFARLESSQIPAFSRLRVLLAGVKPVLAGFQLSNHTLVLYNNLLQIRFQSCERRNSETSTEFLRSTVQISANQQLCGLPTCG